MINVVNVVNVKNVAECGLYSLFLRGFEDGIFTVLLLFSPF